MGQLIVICITAVFVVALVCDCIKDIVLNQKEDKDVNA